MFKILLNCQVPDETLHFPRLQRKSTSLLIVVIEWVSLNIQRKKQYSKYSKLNLTEPKPLNGTVCKTLIFYA